MANMETKVVYIKKNKLAKAIKAFNELAQVYVDAGWQPNGDVYQAKTYDQKEIGRYIVYQQFTREI